MTLLRKYLTKTLVNLTSRAMTATDLTKVKEIRKGRIRIEGEDTPWVRIPNVSSFQIHLGAMDIFFAAFGIKRRLESLLEIRPYKNAALNRYIIHQIRRLGKCRSTNPRLYFHIAHLCMKRSNAFRVLAFNHVFFNWQRMFPLAFVMSTNRKVSKLINGAVSKMEYSRSYIPKNNLDWRPLGVPKPEWRILLHMYSNFLTYYLQPVMQPLHGFLPGKGIISAWKEIFSGLHKKAYIYEWDFASFFDTCNVKVISDELRSLSVPEDWVKFLEGINRSPITLKKTDLVDESLHRQQSWFDSFYDTGKAFDPDGLMYSLTYKKVGKSIISMLQYTKSTVGIFGVAQGAPTSPILSNLIMLKWWKLLKSKGIQAVVYADDSVGFSDNPIVVEEIPEWGIKFAPNKCGYVREAHKDKRPLKFLGLEYIGDLFRAHTRKGSRLGIEPRDVLIGELFAELHDKCQALSVEDAIDLLSRTAEEGRVYPTLDKSFNKLFVNKLAGFVISRLQTGSWNLDEVYQNFNMTFQEKSWMASKLNKWDNLTIFNCSSFASLSLSQLFRNNQLRYSSKAPRNKNVLRSSKLRYIRT